MFVGTTEIPMAVSSATGEPFPIHPSPPSAAVPGVTPLWEEGMRAG